MRHTKIIKDERGTIGIDIDLYVFDMFRDQRGNNFRYDVSVWQKIGKQRDERYVSQLVATPEEILQAKLELWQQIKPQ